MVWGGGLRSEARTPEGKPPSFVHTVGGAYRVIDMCFGNGSERVRLKPPGSDEVTLDSSFSHLHYVNFLKARTCSPARVCCSSFSRSLDASAHVGASWRPHDFLLGLVWVCVKLQRTVCGRGADVALTGDSCRCIDQMQHESVRCACVGEEVGWNMTSDRTRAPSLQLLPDHNSSFSAAKSSIRNLLQLSCSLIWRSITLTMGGWYHYPYDPQSLCS